MPKAEKPSDACPLGNQELLKATEYLLKKGVLSSRLYAMRATLLQLSESGDGTVNLQEAEKCIELAMHFDPYDVETLIDALYFYDVVVDKQRKATKCAKKLKKIAVMIANALDDFEKK